MFSSRCTCCWLPVDDCPPIHALLHENAPSHAQHFVSIIHMVFVVVWHCLACTTIGQCQKMSLFHGPPSASWLLLQAHRLLLTSFYTHRQDDIPRTSVKAGPKTLQGPLRATRCIQDARRKAVVIARGQRAALANDALAATAPI